MPSAFRRLAADHAVLHDDLPPNYLFAPDETFDDLTQLSILLAGPQGTPYSQGVWRLHLRMPEDYPKNPPKATFRTRIWHPNVEETTGAVCVDTLKRDWKTTLTLKDVLITISCLLIYPNPDSALNSTAGALLQEDYEAFARQAKLMSSIHAPVPTDMKTSVTEAKLRGEDAGAVIHEQQDDTRSSRSRKGTRVQSVTMKKNPSSEQDLNLTGRGASSRLTPQPRGTSTCSDTSDNENDENEDGENMPSKENDPSLSPSPVKMTPPSPRKNALGKRPLSVLPMPLEHGPSTAMPTSAHTPMDTDFPEEEEYDMTASEKNVAANNNNKNNTYYEPHEEDQQQPQRKSPKLSVLNRGTNSSGRIRDDISANGGTESASASASASAITTEEDADAIGIFEDAPPAPSRHPRLHRRAASGDGKENNRSGRPKGSTAKSNRRVQPGVQTTASLYPPTLAPSASASASAPTSAATSASASPAMAPSTVKGTARSKSATGTRKVSSSSSKQKPRIGIRRL